MLEILPIPKAPQHRGAWQALFQAYGDFYKRPMTAEIFDTVWAWLNDPAHEVEGVLAVLDGQPVGLAHFRRMPRPLYGAEVGFLDDLFVDPQCRGHKVGEQLIAHVAQVARTRGWATVRWLTADDNYRARALYDRVGRKSHFNLYELVP